MGRAVWSRPPVRRCVTADMATAGPTVVLVSEMARRCTVVYEWGQLLKILSLVQLFARYFIEGLFQLGFRAKGGDLSSAFRSCSSEWFVIIVFGGVCLQNWTRSATTAGAQITEGWQAPRSQVDSVCRGTRTCCMTSSMWAPWMPRLSVASGITPSAGTPAFDNLSCVC